MVNIVSDLAILTTIPEKALNKLTEKIIYCINEAVEESVLAEEEITEIDVGIGILYIKNDKEEPKFKFIPNDDFKESVGNTLNNRLNSLEDTLNNSLVTKITDAYKNIC